MSASAEGRSTPIGSLSKIEKTFEQEVLPPTSLADQMTGFTQSLKSLETALAQEKQKNNRLRSDWAKAQEHLNTQARDAQTQIRELTFSQSRLKEQAQESLRIEGELRSKLSTLEETLTSARTDLGKYRQAWSDLLQREKEAKMIISDSHLSKRALEDAEKLNLLLQDTIHQEREARAKLERDFKHRELENQNARTRVQVAEGRAADKVREHQLEVEKLRNSMEERMSQAKRENHELKKALEHIRAERSVDNERYARRIADERQEKDRITAETQIELNKLQAESERTRRHAIGVEKKLKNITQRGKKLTSRIRLRMQANRKKLKLMAKMRSEERARNVAMSQYLIDERQRLDAALEILLTLPTNDREKLQAHIEILRKTIRSEKNIALPAQEI